MSTHAPVRAFLRALLPDTRLLGAGVAMVWLGVAGAAGLSQHVAAPWGGLAVQPTPPPAEHVHALVSRADRWSAHAGAAHALWEASRRTATDLDDPHQALVLVDRLLAEHPGGPLDTEAMAWRATLLARVDDPRAGLAFQTVAEHAPDHPDAGRWWLSAADHYAVAGQTLPAVESYESATRYPQKAAAAWLALGRLRLAHDPAAAHVAFEAAGRAAQRPTTARLARLGAATALERLEGPEAALAEVDDAIEVEGSDPSLERRRDRLRRGG